jgi:hypothetical protein
VGGAGYPVVADTVETAIYVTKRGECRFPASVVDDTSTNYWPEDYAPSAVESGEMIGVGEPVQSRNYYAD